MCLLCLKLRNGIIINIGRKVINIKTNETIFLMGDILELHRCDNCHELIDGCGKVYWEDRDFTICTPCLTKLIEQVNDRPESIKPIYTKVSIPSSIRWKIWERDNFTCQYCRSRSDLTVDHIHPEALGGNMDESNLTTACRSCNSKKGIKSKEDFQEVV